MTHCKFNSCQGPISLLADRQDQHLEVTQKEKTVRATTILKRENRGRTPSFRYLCWYQHSTVAWDSASAGKLSRKTRDTYKDVLNSSKRKTKVFQRRTNNLFNKMLQRKTIVALTSCPKTENFNLNITLSKN